MTPNELPSKPARDANLQMKRSDGPTKDVTDQATVAHRDKKLPEKSAVGIKTSPPHAGKSEMPPQQRQVEKKGRGAAASSDGYYRLTVRVEEHQLSIVDGALIPGPLAQNNAIQGRFAYEISIGEQLLHADAIPDLGEFRSFAAPEGSGELLGHHRYQLPAYEFDVRVAASELQNIDLSAVRITLLQVLRPDALDERPRRHRESFEVSGDRQLREIGSVVGLPAGLLKGNYRDDRSQTGTRRPATTKARSPGEDSGNEEESAS